MLFAIHCFDKPEHQAVRTTNRDAHLAYLADFKGDILVAGPTIADDGDGMNGSLLIMDFPDRKAADEFAANDPYAKA